ncbi:MAG: glycosyltransferase family 2 protein [Muribaculum sp.]|nr:glycosyltransferase family 2 protein [Muribaculum sp.]
MSVPVVSIIVPIYKVEAFLGECIDSVLAQSYSNYELLLVDDGSPDRCGEICDEYAEKDVRIKVLHKPNGGLSSARNYGMERAKGKWIIFIDSDDIWGDSDGLRKLVEYADKMNLDVLRFEYQAIDEVGNKIYLRLYTDKVLPNTILSNFQMVDKAIAGEWFAWLYLIKRNAIGPLRFDESCPFQEDIDFYCKFFAAKEMRCGYLPEKIYYYRKRKASLTTSANINNLKGSFNLCNVFYEQAQIIDDTNLRDLYIYYAVMMYYWTLGTLSEDPYHAHRKEIIEQLKLESLHKCTLQRMKEVVIPAKSKLFIIPSPSNGAMLFRVKNGLGVMYYKLVGKR